MITDRFWIFLGCYRFHWLKKARYYSKQKFCICKMFLKFFLSAKLFILENRVSPFCYSNLRYLHNAFFYNVVRVFWFSRIFKWKIEFGGRFLRRLLNWLLRITCWIALLHSKSKTSLLMSMNLLVIDSIIPAHPPAPLETLSHSLSLLPLSFASFSQLFKNWIWKIIKNWELFFFKLIFQNFQCFFFQLILVFRGG